VKSTSPIIVLDSGLGGLTVVRAIRAKLPWENIVYFGDTARLPYGSKTAATVTTFVKQIITHLLPLNPKHVVIACNTATALSLPEICKEFPGLPVSGVSDPGARAAAHAAGAKETPTIGVMATEATIRSKAYEKAIHRRRNRATVLLQPAPLLVPIIEDGRKDSDPIVRLALKQYLAPMAKRGMDVLVLGCTHYPVLKPLIQQMLGSKVAVIDSAEMCAEDVARRLDANNLLAPIGPGTDSAGSLRCFVTDDPARFARLGSRFLGEPVELPTWVAPEELYGPSVPTPVRTAV
jgi:glutamate racemase